MNLFTSRKNLYVIILLISASSILSALYIEFILGYKPCNLCIFQRIPYLAGIIISFIGFNYYKNDNILIILIFSLLEKTCTSSLTFIFPEMIVPLYPLKSELDLLTN